MAFWLFKEEPSSYSFSDLEKEGKTTWQGIKNALALQHLRKVRKGDKVFFYQTGKDRCIAGIALVVSDPIPDPSLEDPRLVVVEIKPNSRFPNPVTLETIKKDGLLQGWDLVRLPRLSVIPVNPEQWQRVLELANV